MVPVVVPDALISCIDVVHAAVWHMKTVTKSKLACVENEVNFSWIMALEVKLNTHLRLLP